MLSSVSAFRLTECSLPSKVLNGALLPINNNAAFIAAPEVHTVSIVDAADRVVAFGAVNKFSKNNAYCMLGEVAEKYQDCRVWVREQESDDKMHTVMKITQVCREEPADRSGETLFIRVFEEQEGRPAEAHLIDALVATTMTRFNFEKEKNITVDVMGDQSTVAKWRDTCGFVTADNHRFCQIECRSSDLIQLASERSPIDVVEMTSANRDDASMYDATLTVYNRDSYIDALATVDGLSGSIAYDEKRRVVGYAVCLGERVLSCYADDEHIARELYSDVAERMHLPSVKLFVAANKSEMVDLLIERALSVEPVTRLHTRSTVAAVKWSKVYSPCCGLNVF